VKIMYRLISDVPFANRHAVSIFWTKPQDLPEEPITSEVSAATDANEFTFQMKAIATPDAKQSEAYVATYSLFHIFRSAPKEEKVFLRLPPTWRELWSELAEAKKDSTDAKDREVVRDLRDLVRRRQDQEMEDGVILQEAFRGRGQIRNPTDREQDPGQDRLKQAQGESEYLQKLWFNKAGSPKFQAMLVNVHFLRLMASANSFQQSRIQLPMWQFRHQVVDAVDREQVVIICGETGWYFSFAVGDIFSL
jgi:ATP-dependent RNA helicase DHX29